MKKGLSWKHLFLLLVVALIPLAINAIWGGRKGYVMQLAVMCLLYMVWTSSFNIVSGFIGWFSLGHSVYIGLGAYISGILFTYMGITPWFGMLIGGLIAGIIAVMVGYPTFRLKGSYYTLSTVALVNVFRIIFLNENSIFGFPTNGAMGIKMPWEGNIASMQHLDKTFYFYIVLGLLVIVLLVSNYINNSKTGYYFAAIKTNQGAAATLGVDVTSYKLRAQFLSAFFAAVSGAIYGQMLQFIEPASFFSNDLSTQIAVMAIVGGVGTLWGPVVGALILYPVSEVIRSSIGSSLPGLSLVIYGLVLMLVIYFMPQGIIGYLKKFVQWIFGKIRRKEVANVKQ